MAATQIETPQTELISLRDRAGLRVGIVCDYLEENWPSMDLVADMLMTNLSNMPARNVEPQRIQPSMCRRFTAVRPAGSGLRFNVDRVLNRFWDYPLRLRRHRNRFDVFHVVDHSYAQLVFQLPERRTIVTCHDIDTFRSLVEPAREKRSVFFRMMVQRTLHGLQRAALVVCPSAATYDALLAHKLIPRERLRVVPLGIHPSCSPSVDPAADREALQLLGGDATGHTDLLHVGSTISRKRIDVLLRVFAELRKRFPEVRLIRAGGPFTADQESLIDRLQLRHHIRVLPFLDRRVLAAVYRRAGVVLLPSEREGFGLPVLESMACGIPVVASDIPALRETGGNMGLYCPVGDIQAWVEAVSALLEERRKNPSRWLDRQHKIMLHANRFNWVHHTNQMTEIYHEIAGPLDIQRRGSSAS